MSISKNIYTNSCEIDGYNTYIVGSDQVWNFDITGRDEVFFLTFSGPEARKISYAASIGKSNLNYSDIDFIAKQIDRFDSISVREENAKIALEDKACIDVNKVLDPTLLQDVAFWNRLPAEKEINEDYLLVYTVAANDEVLKTAEWVAEKKGLPIWVISDSVRKGYNKYRYIRSVGPLEYLELFRKAKYIITNSFHGTVFSIIFEKNFNTIPHDTTGTRMVDLLKTLNLENRIIYSNEHLSEDKVKDIDYTEPNKRLEIEKRNSLLFLENSLVQINK